MAQTLYASFNDASLAEKAAGALLDAGAANEDLSIVAHGDHKPGSGDVQASTGRGTADGGDSGHTEAAAKGGISTTTPGDAGSGAAKGAGIGLGLGVLGALASLLIPGVGLVLGGGALAAAIGAAAGTTAAGAISGGVLGYLKDQGVPDHVASHYDSAIQNGGAMLAVAIPTGNLDSAGVQGILSKYGASNLNTY
ncbi:MAG: hypothetical protein LC772_08890 [Chloroflexi bacterium]|nr:hypothetical protein [Chloroflexota bacterium]